MTESNEKLSWFRVKFADGREIEIHATNAIEIYQKDFAKIILEAREEGGGRGEGNVDSSLEEESRSEIPSIKASPGTMDNLRLLLATPWARKGRLVAEFVKALETNAAPDASRNVSKNLARLVKSGDARRIEKEEGYCYYPVSASPDS